MKVSENGKDLNVVILGSPNVNPGYKLVHNSAYPNIARDYQRGFDKLKLLPCDLFLGSHGMYFDLPQKYDRMERDHANPFIASDGYRRYILMKEGEFQEKLAEQKVNVLGQWSKPKARKHALAIS